MLHRDVTNFLSVSRPGTGGQGDGASSKEVGRMRKKVNPCPFCVSGMVAII